MLGLFVIHYAEGFGWVFAILALALFATALWVGVLSIPLPWVAAELGWFVAEVGRQPWAVEGVLPTAVAVSKLGVTEVALTLAAFCVLYTVLFVIEVSLLVKTIRKGPTQDVAETERWQAERARRAGPANALAGAQ